MDCAPLFVVNAEDIGEAIAWASLALFWAGFAGAACWHIGAFIVVSIVRAWRQRGANEPFAARAERLERARLRAFLLLDRIAARRAREAARGGV